VAEIVPDFNQMDGVEVLLYLIFNEPFFWGIISLGIVIAFACAIFDITLGKDDHHPF
jgi:hypothetical protein